MNKRKHIISTILFLVTMMSISMTVSAATDVQWTDNLGGHTAYANATESKTILEYLPYNTAALVTMPSTSTTRIVSFYGKYEQTKSATFSQKLPYKKYVLEALKGEGVYDSVNIVYDASEMSDKERWITIPNNVPTGSYGIGLAYRVKSGDWRVVDGITVLASISERALNTSGNGTFIDAPTGSSYLTYYKVS